jgi:hypothetical protein
LYKINAKREGEREICEFCVYELAHTVDSCIVPVMD